MPLPDPPQVGEDGQVYASTEVSDEAVTQGYAADTWPRATPTDNASPYVAPEEP